MTRGCNVAGMVVPRLVVSHLVAAHHNVSSFAPEILRHFSFAAARAGAAVL